MSRWSVALATAAERNAWVREAGWAASDGARYAWLLAVVAAGVVWVARGMPSPATAAGAALAALVGASAAAWRARRLYPGSDTEERHAVAWTAFRRWTAGYATIAAVVPALMAGAVLPVLLVALALFELAVLTIPARYRARLLARLRLGAAAVAGDEEGVEVGRALWSGQLLDQVYLTYPAAWAAHRDTKRDDLVSRMMWELCGPPPATPAAALARPDYLPEWDHARHRLEITRVATLPSLLPARNWTRAGGAIVLGQTAPDQADITDGGVPLALYRPAAHMLIVGSTQHGKSSSTRAWAVDALTHGTFPGGLWAIDGKGSGSLAPLLGRKGVHAVGHTAAEWQEILLQRVAPEVARRYEQMLAHRSGATSGPPPRHPRALLILDEIQQVLLACPDLRGPLDTLARQALEAGVILWVLTQRPDAKDAVPGAMRDQLVDRVSFGPLSGAGAKMTFDVAGDWHRALGISPVPGRALAWLGGRWRLLQAPWLPIPADDPAAEPLYPQRATPAVTPPETPSEPRPETPPEKSARGDAPPGEEPAGTPQQGSAYDPDDPYASRRRRRSSNPDQ